MNDAVFQYNKGGADIDAFLDEIAAQRSRWAVNVARIERHVGWHPATQADVDHERAAIVGERIDHDFVAIPARPAKKVYAELRLDTDRVANLRWPADGMVVLDADTVEYTGRNGRTYHKLIDWEVAGVRGRSAKILRVEDLPVVRDRERDTE